MRLVSALLVLIFLFGCTKKTTEKKKTLTLALVNEITTLDPARCLDQSCLSIVAPIYETLYEYHDQKRPYELLPLIAQSLPSVSSDGLVYTFKIKPNIKYHSHPNLAHNRFVKAQDFINQIKRLAFPPVESRGFFLFDGKISGLDEWKKKVGSDWNLFWTTDIKGLKAINDTTLELHLTQKYPQILYALAMPFTTPMPEEILKDPKIDLTKTTVGTGAYILKDYNPLYGARLEYFPGYAKKVSAEYVQYYVMKEGSTSWLQFLAGKVDILTLTKDFFELALTKEGKIHPDLAQKNIQLTLAPTLIQYWLAFNANDPVVGKNLNLRLAIAHSIDKKKFVELFTYNTSRPAYSIYPESLPGVLSETEHHVYNIEIAKSFLKKAFPKGDIPEITFDMRGNSTLHRQLAEFFTSEFEKIGLHVKMNLSPLPMFLEKARKGQLQFFYANWMMDYPDPENLLGLLLSKNHAPGPNYSMYTNKKVDELITKVNAMPSSETRAALLSAINKIVLDDGIWIPIFNTKNVVLSHARVKNFFYSDLIYNFPKNVVVE